MAKKYLKKEDVKDLMTREEAGEELNLTGKDRKSLRSYLAGYGSYELLSDEAVEIRNWIRGVLGSRKKPESERMEGRVDLLYRFTLQRPDFQEIFLEAGAKDVLTYDAITCLVPFLSVAVEPGMTIEEFLSVCGESDEIVVQATARYWSAPEVRNSFPTLDDCVADALQPFYEKYPHLRDIEKYVMKNGLAMVRMIYTRLT